MTALKNHRAPALRRRPAPRAVTVAGTIIRVFLGRELVGELILSAGERLLRRDPDIPRDVALKALVLHTRRQEVFGTLPGRDHKVYTWQVVGWDAL
jgi:hypothetical protein